MAAVAAHAGGHAGKIGPNAITRVAEALQQAAGEATTERVFAHAGLAHHLRSPPEAMVDESEVVSLHERLRTDLGEAQARRVARDAGARTAEYLLSHRIPRWMQRVLRALPAALAARVLTAAIGRHAWTFAGSGRFVVRHGAPLQLAIAGCPLCRASAGQGPAREPRCDYYAATFERLFRRLVSAGTQVRETECEASGGMACRFEVRW